MNSFSYTCKDKVVNSLSNMKDISINKNTKKKKKEEEKKKKKKKKVEMDSQMKESGFREER